jgi:hypothetical protein
MTSTPGRFYTTAVALVVFFLFWAVIAARPWAQPQGASASSDPRLIALQTREKRLQARAISVQKIIDRRWANYRTALVKRKSQIAAQKAAQQVVQQPVASSSPARLSAPAPSVKITSVPPVTATKTS